MVKLKALEWTYSPERLSRGSTDPVRQSPIAISKKNMIKFIEKYCEIMEIIILSTGTILLKEIYWRWICQNQL